MTVRPADAARDAAACAAIYAPYVAETAITFETEPVDADAMRERIEGSHAWLVLEDDDGAVAGYAYAGVHRARAAYRWAADVAVYLAPGAQGRGGGRALYEALLGQLREQGVHVAAAGIALPNDASVALHRAFGFQPVGVYEKIGFKAGAWRDVQWWTLRLIEPGDGPPAELAPPRRDPLSGVREPRQPLVSVVVPARDEQAWLPQTIEALRVAQQQLLRVRAEVSEIVVVDNCSHDETADIARRLGARVVTAPEGSIASVRNAGARAARGAMLVFVDADVRVPPHALVRFATALDNASCQGGYPTVEHRPRRRILRVYLRGYAALGRRIGMSQGSAQFCRRSAFEAICGYDEAIFMGEDVDFMWRLRASFADAAAMAHVDDVTLRPSSRRFDSWPLWKTLILTNPLLIRPLMRRRNVWRGWYRDPPR